MSSFQKWCHVGLVSAAGLLAMTLWFSASAVVPQLTSEWSLSASQKSWMTMNVQLGFVLGAVLSALINLADRMSAARLLGASALAGAAANAAIPLLASSPAPAILLRLLTGVALAGIYPPALKLISTWFVSGRGLALGIVIGALTLGSAFPHLLRATTSTLDWRFVVFGTSMLTMCGACLMFHHAKEGPYSYPRATFNPRQIGLVLRNKPVMLANIGYFGHMWELYAMWGWFLAFIQAAYQPYGLGASNASLTTFVVIGSGFIGCVLGGVLADRIGRTATTSLMMITSGTCALLIGFVFSGPLWLLLALSIIWGASVVGDSAQFSAIVTEVGDSSFVGTSLALQLGLGFALTVIAIRILPAFADMLGSWQWAFILLVPGPIIGTYAMLTLRRMPESIKIAQGRR